MRGTAWGSGIALETFGFVGGDQVGHACRQVLAAGGREAAGEGLEPAGDFVMAGERHAFAVAR
jgi:hypothetical protein